MKIRLLVLAFLVLMLSACTFLEDRYYDTQSDWFNSCNGVTGDVIKALIVDMPSYQFESVLDAAILRCVDRGAYISFLVPSGYAQAQAEVDFARKDFKDAFSYLRIDSHSDLGLYYFSSAQTHLSNFLDLISAARFHLP